MLDAKSRNQFGKNPNTNWYTEEWSCFLQHVFLKNIADRYWDIFHFSEIRLGLCNTWWMCSHKMLKKCLCWQRSGFKAFIMLCKMKKKPRLYLFQKYGTMAHVIIIIISEREQPICIPICFWFYYIILDFIILFKRKIKSIVLLPFISSRKVLEYTYSLLFQCHDMQ